MSKNLQQIGMLKNSLLLFIGILIGGIGGYYGVQYYTTLNTIGPSVEQKTRDTDRSIRQGGYTFINPLIECEISSKGERQKYVPFEAVTKTRIRKEVLNTNPDLDIGIYVRNLNNGPWFGINENALYAPASLLKVPVLITYLKGSEEDPTLLKSKLKYVDASVSVEQYFKPVSSFISGKEYTVEELLENMIKNSDNRSMHTLINNMPADFYTKVSTDLGITVPGERTPDDYLSVQDVATFFRILYNASYLERNTSEYALSLLSETSFTGGLSLGVPRGITISHKFGERGYIDESRKEVKQLHDCGIVYYPKYTYLICVVTRGNDFERLSRTIGDISRIVFEEISKAFP